MKKNIIILTLFSVCLWLFAQDLVAQKNTPPASLPTNTTLPKLNYGDPLPANAFSELAKLINPTVVNIFTTSTPRQMRGGPSGRDPFFDMLERFYGFQMQPQQREPATALGTGFVITEDGLIVTNTHVISGADKISVQFSENSQERLEATIVGSDERTDIALIKVNSKRKLPFAQLGSSSELQVGEWVAAFGNPFGQGHTMTKGVISAIGRDIKEINRLPLIQTDTPINPGNSGGPLVNLRGQVIAVNAAIDARAEGIGFAIPSDEVKKIIPQLEKTGRIRAGFLGVNLAEISPSAAIQLGLKNTDGALIAGVERRGPADRAGIKVYDVITEIDGKKIENLRTLMDLVAATSVDSQITAKVIREGKELSIKIKVGERPGPQAQARNRNQSLPSGQSDSMGLGFSITNSTPDLRERFSISDEFSGYPIIVNVGDGPAAGPGGLRPGDVVLDVNRKEVKSASDATKALRKGSNTLRIARGNQFLIVILESK